MPSFNVFPWYGFRDGCPSFSGFPIWLPHHVTYDIIIIIKTFYLSSRSGGDDDQVPRRPALMQPRFDRIPDPNP